MKFKCSSVLHCFFLIFFYLVPVTLFSEKRLLLTTLSKSERRKKYNTMPQVRVLLEKKKIERFDRWLFYSSEGFLITLGRKNNVRVRYPYQWLSIKKTPHGCVLGKTIILSEVAFITPYKASTIQCNEVMYHGCFEIRKHKNELYCINVLPIEKYVRSVLLSEGWPGWPLEVYKAFAIMCRTYVIAMMQEAKKQKRFYHVKNTNVHQTYTGKHKNQVIKQAVIETQGSIIGFQGKPILAMFDSCCGGITPAFTAGFDFKKAPYLARKKACKYCKNYSIYSWKASYSNQKFQLLLAQYGYDVGKIKRIKIIKKDKAGLVQELEIVGKKKKVVLSGQQLYTYIPEVKSFYFFVTYTSKGVLISGRGYGHHIGLCQWGARKMVDKGYTYKKILSFYYPGTELMRLV